jgi:hypothetical protein
MNNSESIEINEESFKKSIHYLRLKTTKYSIFKLKLIENDKKKIAYFYDTVLPSICTQIVIPGEGNLKRWICFENGCIKKKCSFANKHVYFRHLIDKHRQSLPGNGDFLQSKRKNREKSFKCADCSIEYSRKDHLDRHLKSLKHFKIKRKNELTKTSNNASIINCKKDYGSLPQGQNDEKNICVDQKKDKNLDSIAMID